MNDSTDSQDVSGETLMEAQFDWGIAGHGRTVVSGWLLITVVGILLIPFWLLFSMWYWPEYIRRSSARLTTWALEIRKGVFFRTEATIPLTRITDLRLHDGPVMRYYKIRGLKVETAGMSGVSGSEGDIVGLVDAVDFRNAVLTQRQKALDAEQSGGSAEAGGETETILVEIRDILSRIEKDLQNR